MYIISRTLSVCIYSLRNKAGLEKVPVSVLYEHLGSLCRNWEASLDYQYPKSVPKPQALLSLLLKSPTSFLQQNYSGSSV